jgi:hypothetical protein
VNGGHRRVVSVVLTDRCQQQRQRLPLSTIDSGEGDYMWHHWGNWTGPRDD